MCVYIYIRLRGWFVMFLVFEPGKVVVFLVDAIPKRV